MVEGSEEKIQLIIRSIRKTRNRLGCGFFFIGGFGGLMIYLTFATDEGGTWSLVFGILLILLARFGAKIVWPNLRPERAPLVGLLREHPENIAWMYDTPDPGPRGRTITHTITVLYTDKRRHSFQVKVDEVEEMMGMLKSFAPKASVGLTKEIEEKYRQDPWSVISKD
jgi:hypothetical protein